jgi:hypothetical protein
VVRRAVRGGGGAERRGGDAADAVDFSVRVDLCVGEAIGQSNVLPVKR